MLTNYACGLTKPSAKGIKAQKHRTQMYEICKVRNPKSGHVFDTYLFYPEPYIFISLLLYAFLPLCPGFSVCHAVKIHIISIITFYGP